MCACTSELQSLPAREQEGVSAVCVLCEPCVSALKGCPGQVSGQSCQWPFSLCVSLGYVLSLATAWTYKGNVAATSPSVGRDPRAPGWAPTPNRGGAEQQWLEEVAVLLPPHLTWGIDFWIDCIFWVKIAENFNIQRFVFPPDLTSNRENLASNLSDLWKFKYFLLVVQVIWNHEIAFNKLVFVIYPFLWTFQ